MIFPNVKVNFRTLFFCGLSGILLLVLGIYLGFSILPDIVSNKVLDSKILREGTEQWKQFMEMPFPFQFKVYLYNVENPEEVLMGAKPVVKEKGPYVYKLYRWKDEVSWNHTTDEISYYEYQKYEFDKQASGKLTEQDRVTVLNTPFLNFLYVVETKEELDGYLPSINEALKFVFGERNGLFLINTTVKNYLFDGIRICKNGCATDGFVASMVCKMIKQNLNMTKQLRIDGNDILYATLHYKNNTHQGYFTVQSGRKHKWDTGELTRFNNETSVETWINDKYECNKIGGVTNIFPPSVDTSTRMDTFSEDICRSISLEYVRKETVEGIKGYRYVALKTTMSHSENVSENQCYCINKTRNLDGNFGCLYDGVLDLSTCQGAPVLLSFPHLLHADSRYIQSVEGLEPNSSNHEMFVTLEPVSGTPLKVAKRVQFNMFVRPVKSITSLQNVTPSLVPMFWVDESFSLPQQYLDMIKDKVYKSLWIIDIVRYTLLAIALAIISACILLFVYAK